VFLTSSSVWLAFLMPVRFWPPVLLRMTSCICLYYSCPVLGGSTRCCTRRGKRLPFLPTPGAPGGSAGRICRKAPPRQTQLPPAFLQRTCQLCCPLLCCGTTHAFTAAYRYTCLPLYLPSSSPIFEEGENIYVSLCGVAFCERHRAVGLMVLFHLLLTCHGAAACCRGRRAKATKSGERCFVKR